MWDDVVPLEASGHRPVPLTLPGRVTDLPACSTTLAWLAVDARPEKVAKVALIGGLPSADGERYSDFFEVEDGAMPFPGWGPFEGQAS